LRTHFLLHEQQRVILLGQQGQHRKEFCQPLPFASPSMLLGKNEHLVA
jgi:hypothetical protein